MDAATTKDMPVLANCAVVDRQVALVADAPAETTEPCGVVASDGAAVNGQDSKLEDTHTLPAADYAIAECHAPKSDFRRLRSNSDHSADASAVNNRCACTGTDNVQAEADAEILYIGRGGNGDGIAR